jgi:GNAT superfamily N-acetyltransferase
MIINIVEIHKLAEKQMWMNRFLSAYSGVAQNDASSLYGTNVRFFLAKEGDALLGFVRINDKATLFEKELPFKVWNLADGYVKPPYRGKGVLNKLIDYVVKGCDVRMMNIETDRFLNNHRYYQSLGFKNHYAVKNGELTWAFQDDVWPYVVERNKRKD